MHLIHAIPILLQLVQDAEDDLATLAGHLQLGPQGGRR